MSDMPERIWAFDYDLQDNDGTWKNWQCWGENHPEPLQAIEYIRADIHREAVHRAEAMAEKLAEALRITRRKLSSLAHSEFEGVWSEDDFLDEVKEADAAIAEYEASK